MSSLIRNAPQSETQLHIKLNHKECLNCGTVEDVEFKEEHQSYLCSDCEHIFADVFYRRAIL